jgi:hypothetical protein
MPDASNIIEKKRLRMNKIKQIRGMNINVSESNIHEIEGNYSVEPSFRGNKEILLAHSTKYSTS